MKWTVTSTQSNIDTFTARCTNDDGEHIGTVTSGNGHTAWWTTGGSSGLADSVGHGKLAVETMTKIESREAGKR